MLPIAFSHFALMTVPLSRPLPPPDTPGDATSPLASAKSGMNTMIEGGRDQKLTVRLQRLQGMAVKESASEKALRTDFFGKVREYGHRLGLTHAMQVGLVVVVAVVRLSG